MQTINKNEKQIKIDSEEIKTKLYNLYVNEALYIKTPKGIRIYRREL